MEGDPILVVEGLTKRFGGLTALDRLTLHFQAGRLHSIIGPNGAGKTTLFNLLTGLFPPSSGTILLKGRDITHLPPPEIFRLQVVRTFQVSSIFPNLSVLKNAEIAAQGRYRTSHSPWGRLSRTPQELRNRCLECLDRFELAPMRNLSAGLLAYGDKRRLEIVMALVSDPEILLLDEPTAGMSPEETQQTAQFLKGLTRSVTVLLVEHDMKVVMGISDRVTVLHRGAVLADGEPADVQRDPEVRSVYLGRPTA